VKSYPQVQQHLLNLVVDFNNTSVFISRNISTAKVMQCQTLVPFMNHGLERMWKAMVLITGQVIPGRSEEFYVHHSMHHESIPKKFQQDDTLVQYL
jgi:hypothetical protein